MADELPPAPNAGSESNGHPQGDPSEPKGLDPSAGFASPEVPSPPQRPQRTWREALLWILEEIVWLSVVFVGAIGAGVGVGALGGTADTAALFMFHVGLLVYSSVRERAKLAEWFRPTRAALIWGAGTGVAMIVTGAIYAGLLRLAGIEIPDVAAELRSIVPSRIVLIAWGAFVVPVAEELYFRGRLIDGGRKYFRTSAAVVIAGLAFAVVHGVPVLIPAYLALAWLLWNAREKTGGLFAPVLAHAINNLIGLLAEGP